MATGLSPLAGYMQSDTDESATMVQYSGYLNAAGAWFISQAVSAGGIMNFTYVAGSGLTNYQNAWTNRSSLPYDYFSNVFKNT